MKFFLKQNQKKSIRKVKKKKKKTKIDSIQWLMLATTTSCDIESSIQTDIQTICMNTGAIAFIYYYHKKTTRRIF